jgi:flagellar hook-length control protein FliK
VEPGSEKAAAMAPSAAASAAAGTGKADKAATAKADKTGDNAKQAGKADAKTKIEGEAQADSQGGKPAADPQKAEKAEAHARGEVQAKDFRATADVADKPSFDPALNAPSVNADATQTAALAARTQQTTPAATAAAAATAAPAAQQAAAIPLSGVAFEITSKALSSTNHFEIRLDPPDLGRIEVRLDVDGDGNVTSRMIVDRPETLDLLRRDAAGLDRALQDAGLKTSNNGLQFQLRDQSGDQQQQQSGGSSNTARLVVQDESIPNTAIARDYGRLAGNSSGVDIHV